MPHLPWTRIVLTSAVCAVALMGCGDDTKTVIDEVVLDLAVASDPTPEAGDDGVATSTTLEWTAPNGALDFTVYLSDDPTMAALDDASSDGYLGSTPDTSWSVSDLDEGTTYYWRVDSRFAIGTAYGRIWSFTTAGEGGGGIDAEAPDAVASPDPADGATDVAADASLAWGDAARADSYDVYFGTDASTVANDQPGGDSFAGNVGEATWTPDALDAATTYYWRVDSVGDGGTTAGPLWTFTTAGDGAPARATDPQPEADAVDVAVDAALSWTGDTSAVSFDLYVGTSFADVATGADEALAATELTESTWANEGAWPQARTVYWRVDTIGAQATTRGVVWAFDTFTPELPVAPTPTMPEDGALDVPVTPVFGWDGDADSFTVYLADGDAPLAEVGTTTSNEWVPDEPLDYATVYRWRVDATNAAGTVASDVVEFVTDAEPSMPWFGGADTVLALGPDALLVTWSTPLEGTSAPADHTYRVWVANSLDAIDYESTPVAEVTGDTRVVLGTDELGARTGGSTVWVAVRAVGEDGVSDGNVTVLPAYLPIGDARIHVDATAGEGGDGSLGAPFATAAEALAAVVPDTPETTILMAAGTYAGPATLDVEGAVRIVGGFSAFTDGSTDTDLLGGFDPDANATVFGDAERAGIATPILDLAGGTRHLVGLTFADYTGTAIGAGGGDVQLIGNRFLRGDTQLVTEVVEEETVERSYSDVALDVVNEAAASVVVAGNRFEDINDGVQLAGPFAAVHATTNRPINVENFLFAEGRVHDADGGSETAEFIVTDGVSVRITGNRGYNFDGYLDLDFVPSLPVIEGQTIDVLIDGNRARAVDRSFARLHQLGGFGDDATINVTATNNFAWAVQSEYVDVNFFTDRVEGEGEDEVEVLESFAAADLVFEDNVLRNGNSEIFELSNLTPADGGSVSVIARRNIVSQSEDQLIEISSSEVDEDRPDESTRTDVTFELIYEDNILTGTDGGIDIFSFPLPATGEVTIRFNNNFVSGTGEAFYWSNSNWMWLEDSGVTRDVDVTVEIIDNVFEGEEDQIDVQNLRMTGGDQTWTIRDNAIVSNDNAITISTWSPEYEEESDNSESAEGGAFRMLVEGNETMSRYDGFEGRFFGTESGSELIVLENTFTSLDDYPIDVDFGDFDLIDIRHNTLKGIDDDGLELSHQYSLWDGTTRVVVFDNEITLSERSLLDLFSRSERDIDESEVLANVRQLDVWIANNTVVDSNESDAGYIRGFDDATVLWERNVSGRNDVDSDEALEVSCEGPASVRIRNSIMWEAGGEGIEVRRCNHVIENVTVGNSGGTSTSAHGIRSSSDQVFVLNSIVSTNAGDGDFDQYASPPVYTFYQWGPAHVGLGSVVADEAWADCDDPLDIFACSQPGPLAPVYDAGHPAERFNDTDGTRNDMGARGGPHAGPIGHLDGSPEPDFVLIGIRPHDDAFGGSGLAPVDAAIDLAFNLPVDAATLEGAVSVTTEDGDVVSGTWSVDGHRAAFTPSSALAPGTAYEVAVTSDAASAGGQALRATEYRAFTTDVETTLADAEPNDTTATAVELDGQTAFRIEGTVAPYAEVADALDMYAIELEAGDQLTVAALPQRNARDFIDDIALIVVDPDGAVASRWVQGNGVQNDDEDGYNWTVVNFVAPEAGTWHFVVAADDLDDSNRLADEWPELTFRGGSETAASTGYALYGAVRPIAP